MCRRTEIAKRVGRLMIGTWILAMVARLTVITGISIADPWYRALALQGADLHRFPRLYLLANSNTAGWHNLGMEWKEHVARTRRLASKKYIK